MDPAAVARQQSKLRRAKDYEDERQSSPAGGAATDLSALVQLRRKVRYRLESSGWSRVLVYADALLSVISVVVYIVMTYSAHRTESALNSLDLALACYFAAYWLLRFWLSDGRARFLLSWSTLIDLVTILPVYIAYNGSDAPAYVILRMLRVLRVLRLFNMTHATSRLESAVWRSSVNLGLTMVSMMLIAAALFLEAERLGPNKDEDKFQNMQFHEAVYWATITLTTVGYGDISPTYWVTQCMAIVVLLIAFTALPLMTGRLVDALNTATKYQRDSFKPRSGAGGHLVFMGHLDGATLARLMDEVYHKDKGFDDRQSVFLAPLEPSLAVRRVLLTHPHASKMTYLQGSPFRNLDLERTRVEYAEAVFIICDKYATDATTEDRRHSLTLMAVGQYLGERAVESHYRRSLKTPCLACLGTQPPLTLPRFVIQLLLPQSRQVLQANLQVLGGATEESLALAYDETPTGEPGGGEGPSKPHARQDQVPANKDPAAGTAPVAAAAAGAAAGGCGRSTMARARQRRAAAAAAAAFEELGDEHLAAGLGIVTGAAFWRRLAQGVEVLCVDAARGAVMAHSALGCPGVATLLGNLIETEDDGDVTMERKKDAPQWLLAYLAGSRQELYEVPSFPPCLHGTSFREAAAFVYDETGAVLIATDDAAAKGGGGLRIMPLDQDLTDAMCGYVIANDLRQALAVCAAKPAAYEAWRARNPWGASLGGGAAREATKAAASKDIESGAAPAAVAAALALAPRAAAAAAGAFPMARSGAAAISLEADPPGAGALVGAKGASNGGAAQARPCSPRANLLRAASRRGRDVADAYIECHYHCRGPGEALGAAGIVLEGSVPFDGHVLVFGPVASPEGLFSLLAPLRSKRLERWRPVVVVDTQLPQPGSAWDNIARLKDVWFCEGSAHNAADLLRANAEHAVRGVLLPRFEACSEEDAALEAAAMSDGATIETWHQLRTINPDMELMTEMMLSTDAAYLYPITPIPGIRLRQVGLSPAYMSGAVFLARCLDSLTIQAFTNHGAHRIVLALMHQWHSASAPRAPGARCGPAAAAAGAAGAPTVVLVRVEAPWTDGWSYGAYWHDLLHQQGMLALGLYRPVRQQGLAFDCVIVHPAPDTPLRPGDRAYVIANLGAAGGASDDGAASNGGAGSAWPAACVGFDYDLTAEEFEEFEAAAAALASRQQGAEGGA